MDTTLKPTTWEAAFQSESVSSIRLIERQLRASTLQDREKLRALVGNNYRELLSTAEQIVLLSDKTRTAESSLSSLGQACQPESIKNRITLTSQAVSTGGRLKFLDAALRCSSSAVKRKALLQASKLLIISRLLLNSLSGSNVTGQVLQHLQTRIKFTRQGLLKIIDGTILSPAATTKVLCRALVAYCLLTSSSLVDAVKHFLDVRSRTIRQKFIKADQTASARKDIYAKCHYLIATVASFKALSGRIVIDASNDLQKHPILEGADLVDLETLQLDTYRTFLPSDILSFVPYFKRVVPTPSETRLNAETWVGNSIKTIVLDLESHIANVKLAGVLHVRQEVLSILLPSCFTAMLHQSTITRVREVFSQRISQLIDRQASAIDGILGSAPKTQRNPANDTFWRSKVAHPDSSRSTDGYLKTLRKSHFGIHEDLQKVTNELHKWARGCNLVRSQLENLSLVRWRDKLEDYTDEDEDEAQSVIDALVNADPQQYTSRFTTILCQKSDEYVDKLAAATNRARTSTENGISVSDVAALLRISRELHTVLRVVVPGPVSKILSQSVAGLHDTLAEHTAAELFALMESKTPTHEQLFSTDDLPSPLTISVLQKLSSIMLSNGGVDLWTTAAVKNIRRVVYNRVTSDEFNQYYVASDFDRLYLSSALGERKADDHTISHTTGRKAATYWNRTRALFGILDVAT